MGSSDSYYGQFAEIHGVSIKATRHVAPETLQMVARVVNLMLDGRADIRECIEGQDSSYAVLQKGHKFWNLPGFNRLLSAEDIWGRAYDNLLGWGAEPNRPITVVSESTLLGETDYRPYDVAIHEFANSIMNLCFDHATMRKLDSLYRAAVDAKLGFGIYIMADRSKFFAEFSSVYFDAHTDLPRRALVEKLPDLLGFLEEIYGEITVHDSARHGFVRYTTRSGITVPWEVAHTNLFKNTKTRVYEDPESRFSIEIPRMWKLAAVESESVLWKHVAGTYITGSFSVEFSRLPVYEFGLASQILDEFVESWQLGFEAEHSDWNEFSRRLSVKQKVRGIDWVTSDYYGAKSQDHCPVNIRTQIAVITHRDVHHRAVLRMVLCTDEPEFEDKWYQLSNNFMVVANVLK